jgi:membrane protease YdiL (CAAX protease family)
MPIDSAPRRYVEALAFVTIWMAIGWIFRLGVNAYLLLGVPLVALFQLFIRRQPLATLWARDATSFRLGWVGIGLAVLLILAPGYNLVVVALPGKLWILCLWYLCASAGAVFGAFALCQQRLGDTRRALPSFIAAVIIGSGLMVVGSLARGHWIGMLPSKLSFQLKQFLLYFPVLFVLEEVVFRGALDSHVYQTSRNGQAKGSPWLSAIFVSALWGIWHLPTRSIPSVTAFVALILAAIIFHTLIGVPLSFCWRTSGTLALPAAAHALIDAYRNVLL